MTKTASLYYPSKNYPNRLSQGASFVTAVDAGTLTSNANFIADTHMRIVIAASEVDASGSTVRVTLQAGSTNDAVIASAYIGHQASSGNAYDFDGNQAQLLFSASGSTTVSAGTTKTSDSVSFSLDATKNLVLSVGFTSLSGTGEDTTATATNFDFYVSSGSGASEAGDSVPASGLGAPSNDRRNLFGLIEVVPDSWVSTFTGATLDQNNDGFANYGIRQLIPASAFSINGSTVRVTFEAGATQGLDLDGAYIGHKAASGDAYDFDGNQAQLTFSGSNTVSIGTSSTVTSDGVTFSLDSTKDIIIAMGVKNDTNVDFLIRATSQTGYALYYKSGGNGEEGTTDVTGYSVFSNELDVITKIEVLT